MTPKPITFQPDLINDLLTYLSRQPYADVAQLIMRISATAVEQSEQPIGGDLA